MDLKPRRPPTMRLKHIAMEVERKMKKMMMVEGCVGSTK